MGLFDLFKSKCSVDGIVIESSQFNIVPIVPTGVNREKKIAPSQVFCQQHFLEEFANKLKEISLPFLFCEPIGSHGQPLTSTQNYFYTPDTLAHHAYDGTDKEDLIRFLSKASTDKPVIWLPKDIIGNTNEKPLFKVKDGDFDRISYDELMNRLASIFCDPMKKYNYTVNLPYDSAGIYVYYDYI